MQANPMKTQSGEEHGLSNVVGNSVQDDGMKRFSEKDRPKMESLKKEECRIVKARYMNHRGPNERLEKPYCRWAGEPIQMWRFIPGQVYDVPKGLVDEVNDPNKVLKQRSEILDKNGQPTTKEGAGMRIHEFVPVGF